MKAIVISIIMCFSVWNVSAVRADDLQKAKGGSTARTGERSGVNKSWRYQFHQGRWWYWLPANRWAVFENGRWLMPPGESPRAVAHASTTGETIAPVRRDDGGSFAEDYPAAPVTSGPAKHSTDYYLSVGNVFSRHAHEHAQVLERYAASKETVPARIVREQAQAIHHDVEQAQKSFSQVAAAGEQTTSDNLPDVIKKLQTGLAKVTESVRRLEMQVRRQEKVQATLVRGQTAVINRMLQQANEAARAAEEEQRKYQRDQEDRAGID